MYRIAPTDQRPMPLAVTSEEFATEWRACWQDMKRDMTALLVMARPYLDRWERQLTQNGSEKEIGFITLCRLLSNDPSVAMNKIIRWKEYLESTSSVKEELEILFIKHVRTARYFPEFAKALNAEWVIAQDYRYKLKDKINACHHWEVAYSKSGGPYEVAILPNWPDYLLLKNMNLDRWKSYLLFWKLTGQSTMEVSRKIHIPRDTFYHEEKQIWDSLSKIYCEQE